MIIDPQTFMTVETDRRLAEAASVRAARQVSPRRTRRHRRGPLLRLVATATGRAVHA